MVAAGVIYNGLSGRRHLHAQRAAAKAPALPRSRFTAADLHPALAHYNPVLDISRDDLEALLHDADLAAFRRNLGDLRCADVMSHWT